MACIAIPVAILLWKAILKLVNWCRGKKEKEEEESLEVSKGPQPTEKPVEKSMEQLK